MSRRRQLRRDEGWVLEFARSFSGVSKGAVDVTEWRNSTIYQPAGPDPTWVVKAGRDWTPEFIEHWKRQSEDLRRALGKESDLIPEVLGIHRARLAVATRFVPGVDGGPWLRDRMARPTIQHMRELREMMATWGRSLATFHAATASSLDDDAPDVAHQRIEEVAGVLRMQPSTSALATSTPCKSFVDVGFHNTRVRPDGSLSFFDFSEVEIITTVHQDVADAVAWLEDAYRDAPSGWRATLREQLVPAFFTGYGRVSGLTIDDSAHIELLALFLCRAHLQWVRTAVQRRHHRQAVECLGRASWNWVRAFVG